MITRNGVCYDLSISEYKYSVDGLTYVFSSKLHLDNFKKKYLKNRSSINKSLTNRFKVFIEANILADIVLYSKIETRGFLIIQEDKELWQKENITLSGEKVIYKTFQG